MTTSTCCRLRQGWLRMPLITNEIVTTIRNQIVQTYHVCAEGNLSVDRSSRWIWNFWNPFMPSRAANPCNGTLLVPVTNWRNLARSAWSKDLRALQNHWICYKKKWDEDLSYQTEHSFLRLIIINVFHTRYWDVVKSRNLGWSNWPFDGFFKLLTGRKSISSAKKRLSISKDSKF